MRVAPKGLDAPGESPQDVLGETARDRHIDGSLTRAHREHHLGQTTELLGDDLEVGGGPWLRPG
jgi:hypothetical protein